MYMLTTLERNAEKLLKTIKLDRKRFFRIVCYKRIFLMSHCQGNSKIGV